MREKPVLTMLLAGVLLVLVSGGSSAASICPEGMVSYWKFDESSGTTAEDFMGCADGTIYGATRVSGVVGGALTFDGVDDYVDYGPPTSFDWGVASTPSAE